MGRDGGNVLSVRGNWTVEVELDCIITATGEGEVKKTSSGR